MSDPLLTRAYTTGVPVVAGLLNVLEKNQVIGDADAALYTCIITSIYPLGAGSLWLLTRFREQAPGWLAPFASVDPNLTKILKRTYMSIADTDKSRESEERIRLTLFVPQRRGLRLVQRARFCWDDNTVPSDTVIRMGTGDVGRAYTAETDIRIDAWKSLSPQEPPSFVSTMRHYGVEPEEAESHGDQHRKSFLGLPIVSKGRRLGVLSADAIPRNTFLGQGRQKVLERGVKELARYLNAADSI